MEWQVLLQGQFFWSAVVCSLEATVLKRHNEDDDAQPGPKTFMPSFSL